MTNFWGVARSRNAEHARLGLPYAELGSGNCKVCGCPPDKMPMVFRGTGWCCDNHRKELEKENKPDD